MSNISTIELAEAISSELDNYSEEIADNISEQIDEITKRIVSDLKSFSEIPTRSGKYKKGFFSKTVAQGIDYKRNVIGNKKPQLTHLLEKGHDVVRNGKKVGTAKAYPHWDKAKKNLEKLMDEVINKL